VLSDEETLYNQTMPKASPEEIQGVLDAIKAMTGGYVARGEEMQLEPKKSQWGDFQAKDEDGYLVYHENGMKPYEANLTRDELQGILEALSMQPAYRPMPEQGSPEYDAELMRRYPQFFGFK
jgi:hypothetical protein